MQKSFLILFMLACSAFTSIAQDGMRIVANLNNPDELLIAPGSLYAFNRFVYRDNIAEKLSDLKIESRENQYYLLCKGINSGRIHAFQLSIVDEDLFLSPENQLFVCEQGEVSLDSFQWEGQSIMSCINEVKYEVY